MCAFRAEAMIRTLRLLLVHVRWTLSIFALVLAPTCAQASDKTGMSLAAKLSILVEKYPEALKNVTANHVITAKRTRLLVDDRLAKTHKH